MPLTAARRLRGGWGPVQWNSELPRHRRRYVADPAGNRLELL